MEFLTIQIESELKKEFKIKCITDGKGMKEVIVELIKQYVRGEK